MKPEKTAFRTEEIWCENNGKNIYGVAYIPQTAKAKLPLVIFSHELGNTHTAGAQYAERLAEAGFAVYTFDFCGGTVGGGNRSDGTNTDMSVMTEVSDLEAVLASAKTWDFVDADRITLMGGSQGGAVTALAGSRHSDEINGMILLYPALCIFSDVRERFGSIENVPEEYDMFGGWIRVGRRYAADVWDVDVYGELAGYPGKVLLLHGDSDNSVDISYSERAAEVIGDCDYHVIPGGGHEFFGKQFDEAAEYVLNFVKLLNENNNETENDTQAARELRMLINDTAVAVTWEDNESVAALKELVSPGPLTVQMSMYGGFEQVGPIGTRLPASDVQTTTAAGDIVLYSGNQIVVFYGSNSWAYTRLGHITDPDATGMAALLGNGSATITISMEG